MHGQGLHREGAALSAAMPSTMERCPNGHRTLGIQFRWAVVGTLAQDAGKAI